MAISGADLLTLQSNIKRDPGGYADEFGLQWRHFKASLALYQLSPAQSSQEFTDLVTFLSHTVASYPEQAASFTSDVMKLLESQASLLDPALRTSLVKGLILLRNKRQLSAQELLPLLFRLFRVQDKALRALVSRHITADIKAANKKGRSEKLNRSIQNFLYGVLADEHEGTAKRGLAVLTEMWRRHVWRDARTVNVIATAVFHKSPRIMLAALKFFLGQDTETDTGASDDEDDREGGEGATESDKKAVVAPSKEDVYKAFHKGTVSSKKKKQKKLKRAMAAVRKASRREEGSGQTSFAALQLLNDPQGFADKLFARLRAGGERFETRLVMMTVLSRAIGVHKLLVLNFYPFLQKYITPAQRDVTQVIAALVQACHDLVPPDALAPVLRQLVDQFVHDKARPEVMTVGLKSVREICLRSPLIMTPELLQDLVEYKKFRDKEVSAAARGLLGLFRELAPGMLARRDRGRMASGQAEMGPAAYGTARITDRIDGVELLEDALRAGRVDDDGHLKGNDSGDNDTSEDEQEGLGLLESDEDASDVEEDEQELDEDEDFSDDLSSQGGAMEDNSDGDEEVGDDATSDEGERENRNSLKRPRRESEPESLASLKKLLAATQTKDAVHVEEGKNNGAASSVPLEWGRILTQADFATIRELKHRQLVDAALQKHGLKSASKRAKAREAAEEEADEALSLQEKLGLSHEHRVDPSDLLGARRGRRNKEERMASVLEGREGREFGAKARLKKNKSGGLSNREKSKRKNLPLAARVGQVRRRMDKNKLRSAKNFKGHVRK